MKTWTRPLYGRLVSYQRVRSFTQIWSLVSIAPITAQMDGGKKDTSRLALKAIVLSRAKMRDRYPRLIYEINQSIPDMQRQPIF